MSSWCDARKRRSESTGGCWTRGIIGGYDLGQVHPMLEGQMLFCATEMNTRAEIERLVRSLRG